MAGGAFEEDDEITGINVTPLVDVTLVLLIIFMVTANYIVSNSIQVQLPEASTGTPTSKQLLTFVLDKDSQLYYSGRVVQMADIPAIVDGNRKEQVELQALIAADKSVPHGIVVQLINIVRKSGISDFAINVDSSNSKM